MALINCPECGKEVSDKAKICPKCGYSIEVYVKRKEQEESLRRFQNHAEKISENINVKVDELSLKVRNNKIKSIAILVCIIAFIVVLNYVISASTSDRVYEKDNIGLEHVYFGAYEQDNITSNGKEPIEWLVLHEEDGKKLLVSRYCLDFQNYGDTDYTLWDNSNIRTWLNRSFYTVAFSEEEKKAITRSNLKTPGYLGKQAPDSDDTEDYVFLLHEDDAYNYFEKKSDLLAAPTEYAESLCDKDWKIYDQTGSMTYWLRNAATETIMACVDEYGISHYYCGASSTQGVRPAIWVDSSTELLESKVENVYIANRTITVDSEYIEPKDELEINHVNTEKGGNYVTVTGSVTNQSDKTVYYVKVVVKALGDKGRVIDTDWTYAVGSEGLRPGESTTFELMMKNNSSVIVYSPSILEYE